jgi:cobalt-zinc-cadmium efflux system membrane fusion protein
MTNGSPRLLHLTRLLLAVLVVSSIAGGIYYFKGGQDNKSQVAAPVAAPSGVVSFPANAAQLSSIATMTVRSEPLPVSAALFGRVAYDENRTTRVSSPIAGRVVSLHGEVGDQVKLAQVLAELDAPDVGTADADWQKARADQVKKQRAFDRAKILFEGEVLAKKDFESAEADIDQARSETRRAALRMRNLDTAGAQNGIFSLKARMAGVIAERQINPGQEVRPDLPTPLFVITDLASLWVIVDVPEQVAAQIQAGQSAVAESDAWPGQRFTAKVERVGIMLDPQTRRIQIRCAVQNPEHRLKPEMFARVSFLPAAGAVQAIAVPNGGLFLEGRYSYVFVQTKPGTFEKRRVGIRQTGNERSYIDSGLDSGEQVVTEGALLLNSEAGGDAH